MDHLGPAGAESATGSVGTVNSILSSSSKEHSPHLPWHVDVRRSAAAAREEAREEDGSEAEADTGGEGSHRELRKAHSSSNEHLVSESGGAAASLGGGRNGEEDGKFFQEGEEAPAYIPEALRSPIIQGPRKKRSGTDDPHDDNVGVLLPSAPHLPPPPPPCPEYSYYHDGKGLNQIKTDYFGGSAGAPEGIGGIGLGQEHHLSGHGPGDAKAAPGQGEADFSPLSPSSSRSDAKSGKIISLLTSTPDFVTTKPRAMFKAQRGLCKQCKGKLPSGLFSKWFKCRYTGALYCDDCHTRQKRPMPWRLVNEYNPRPSYVCTFAQQYLDSIASVPLLSMDRLRPGFPKGNSEFERIHVLRKRLALACEFIRRCPEGNQLVGSLSDPLKGNQGREHLLSEGVLLYMYSLRDLVHGTDGRLKKWLRRALGSLVEHAKKGPDGCQRCQSRAGVCAICNDSNKLVYPFDTEDYIHRCPGCLAYFHKKCIKKTSCPKCAKIEAQLKSK